MAQRKYLGSITTSGSSEAFRLEKSLFRAYPEFRQKAKVQASVIAPGKLLISLIDDSLTTAVADEDDPLIDAFLAFIANDISANSDRLHDIPQTTVARGSKLAQKIVTTDSDVIPDDVTF